MAGVFQTVAQGQTKQGWVALSNSLRGDVAETAQALQKFPVTVVRTCDTPIHHCLASQTKHFQVIASHPQALKQCSKFLKQQSSHSTLEASSTSAAMQLAAEDKQYAAIGSVAAAKHFGLRVIGENIEDDPNNTTCFGLIEKHHG